MSRLAFGFNRHNFRVWIAAGVVALPVADVAASTEHLISSSVSRFNCSSVNPGDIVTIAGGTRGPLTIANCHGSSSKPITIRNDPSSHSPVVIRRSPGAEGGFVFVVNNSRYIVIDGTGGWSGKPSGAYCGAPSGRDGCGIQIISAALGDSPTAFYKINGENMRDQVHKGIMIDGSSSYQNTAGSRIGFDLNDHNQPGDGPLRENITLTRNYVTGVWGEGMYLGPNPSLDTVPLGNIEVSYNLVENTGRDGVEAKSVYKGVARIIGNFALNVGRRSNSRGQHNGLTVGGNSVFESNWVEQAGEAGIRAIAWNESPASGPFTTEIFNNVVIHSGVSGPNAGHGISVFASDGFEVHSKIYNNTVVNNLGRGINVASGAGPSETWNNIAVGNEGGDVGIGSSGSSVRNNLTGDLKMVGFVDAPNRDYRLRSGSPAIDAASGTTPTVDFDGTLRPVGNGPDQGAFEFTTSSSPPETPELIVQ